ncbi:helix-hairpin-helix domain-containing protein [Romboutsia sp.]|uniref:helix-hairpin-helix domain-containing protein n=1 Tax=Romboutsia sp. TaxID=1965302 RepID=UPI002B65E40D|nr:helix-hairpin-helix domain-containing protein [Romboutsia sp.]HSQ89262.1 helix-hairpin-helix domain-containing protein [Romboutsia sp.]
MNKFGKIIIFSVAIILSICTIILKQDLAIKENVYIVSKSEDKRIDIPKGINKEVDKEKYKIDREKISENNKNMITIFISGEVKKPGVVTIESNKRLHDAIEQLGGFTNEADLNQINLAMRIEDENHYIIPKIGDNTETNDALTDINYNISIKDDNQSKTQKININTASIQELDTLPGIGESTANKIINYREEKGKFNTIEAIKNVNGIGDKKYEDIKDMISVN